MYNTDLKSLHHVWACGSVGRGLSCKGRSLDSIPALQKLDVVVHLCKFKTSQGYLRSYLRERGGGQGGSLTLGF